MPSSASSSQDVRKSYQVHANCYIQKPANLERSRKLVEAVETFWMDFALLSSCDGDSVHPKGLHYYSLTQNGTYYCPQVVDSAFGRAAILVVPGLGKPFFRSLLG